MVQQVGAVARTEGWPFDEPGIGTLEPWANPVTGAPDPYYPVAIRTVNLNLPSPLNVIPVRLDELTETVDIDAAIERGECVHRFGVECPSCELPPNCAGEIHRHPFMD